MIGRALTNTGWLMGARGFNAVLSLGYLALTTRALGLEGFGQFVLVFTFAQLVVGFTSFQTWQAIIQWGQEAPGRREATGFALALDGLTIALGTVAAALLLWLAGPWLPIAAELRPAAFAFTLVSLLAIRSTPTGLLRLDDRYALAAGADAVLPVIRVAGAGIAALVAPRIEAFLLAWAIAEIATAIAYWRLAARANPIAWQRPSLVRLPRTRPGAWRFVLATSLTAMLTVASRQLLVMLLGVLGGAALAGIYRVAAQLGEGLLKLAQALLRATYPELVRNPAEAAFIAARIARISAATGAAAMVLALFGGEWLIRIIAGQAYLAAWWPMLLLSAAAALELAGASLEGLLVARGRALLAFSLRAAPTLLALAALPLLVAWNGASGAALGVLGASAVTLAGFLAIHKRTGAATAI